MLLHVSAIHYDAIIMPMLYAITMLPQVCHALPPPRLRRLPSMLMPLILPD